MIEIEQVHKRFGRKHVLKDVTFTAEKGRITCLIGINGSGKSTLLKAIMGLTPINSGKIQIDGHERTKGTYEKVSFVPDRLTMPSGMRVTEALRFMADFYAGWNPERAADLIDFFSLQLNERIGNLSKGTAAKLSLVLGLGQDSDYIIMDEPFSGIDMFSREQIAEVFTSDLIEERGVLLTTHEIADMEHLIDQAVLLKNGSIIRSFDCETVRSEEGKSVIDMMREVYLA